MNTKQTKIQQDLQSMANDILHYCEKHHLVLRFDVGTDGSKSIEVHPDTTAIVPCENDGQMKKYDWDNIPLIDLQIETYNSNYDTVETAK